MHGTRGQVSDEVVMEVSAMCNIARGLWYKANAYS